MTCILRMVDLDLILQYEKIDEVKKEEVVIVETKKKKKTKKKKTKKEDNNLRNVSIPKGITLESVDLR